MDDPRSCYRFEPRPEKPFLAMTAASDGHRRKVIIRFLQVFQQQAKLAGGLDYRQVFKNAEPLGKELWFIEDDEGGAITALLPRDCWPAQSRMFQMQKTRPMHQLLLVMIDQQNRPRLRAIVGRLPRADQLGDGE